MSRILVHQFSPQRTAPEVLEAIAVGREEVLQGTVAKIRDSALSGNKHHSLFVGPRGIGKTLLLSLIHHRIQKQPKLVEQLRIAWLNEDEISSTFLLLLVRIYRELSSRYPDEFPTEALDTIRGTEPEGALARLVESTLTGIGDHVVVLMIENLDAHFAKMQVGEQRRWRAFIQDNPRFVTIATAQRLFDGVTKQDMPFFGFFDTRHLQPLTAEQATQVLVNIAELHGEEEDREFVQFLKSSRGRARLTALYFLAGGNPRLYVLLSDLLTAQELDYVVDAFEEMVDRQLTSYYQERLRWISQQQQEIVLVLCRHRRPIAVKEIAADLFTTSQSISGQLTALREFGYVRAHRVGRETLYELAEPLMRLVLEAKQTQNRQPMTLIVDFLRVWFDHEELTAQLAGQHSGGTGQEYLQAAISYYERGEDLRSDLLATQAQTTAAAPESGDPAAEHMVATVSGDPDAGSELNEGREASVDAVGITDTRADGTTEELLNSGLTHARQGNNAAAIGDFTRVVELSDAPVDLVARALLNRGSAYGHQEDADAEISDYTRLIGLPGAPVDQVAKALRNRGLAYCRQGEADAGISDYTRLIDLQDAPVDQVARVLCNRGFAYSQRGDANAGISDYTRLIDLQDAPVDQIAMALFNRGLAYGQQGDGDAGISDYTRLIDLQDAPVDPVAMALFNRGHAYGQQGDADAGISDYTRLIDLQDAPVDLVAKALCNRGLAYRKRGDTDAEISDYTRLIDLPDAPVDQVAQAFLDRGFAYMQQGDPGAGISDCTRLIDLPDAPDDQVAMALLIRGHAYATQDDTESAIQDFKAVTVLDAPNLSHHLMARLEMAKLLVQVGRLAEGSSELARILATPDESFSKYPAFGRGGVWADLLRIAFPAGVGEWQTSLAAVLRKAVVVEAVANLGEAMVRHLGELSANSTEPATLAAWRTIWEELGKGHDGLLVPIRLLATGIDYIISRDERDLLALPLEERRLLRDALGLDEE